jgi:large subunit ribosomal protein L15
MKYNELEVTANKGRKRVGRGIAAGQGKTAGRGTKGQGARTGKKLGATFQGGQRTLVRAVPKARGFKSLRTPAQVVYLDTLNALKGKVIDHFVLYEEGYIDTPFHAVKVIVRGEITEKVTLHVSGISKTAEAAVVKAGGSFVKTPVPLRKSTKEAETTDKK